MTNILVISVLAMGAAILGATCFCIGYCYGHNRGSRDYLDDL